MSVKLRKKSNKDGTTSLYLDIYHDGSRRYEFLHQLKLHPPKTAIDREANRSNLDLAKRIAVSRAQELAAGDYRVVRYDGRKMEVVSWMQSFIDSYKKKDKRNLQGALNRFSDFLAMEKKTGMRFGELTEVVISDFQDYLRARCTGEGSSSYFYRFKKMIRQAFRQKVIPTNPASEVRTVKGEARKRDILTLDEIQLLAITSNESPMVKSSALFSLVTGLRWAEVYALRWKDISMSSRQMVVFQGKGEKYKRVNLNDTAVSLIGTPGDPDDKVFLLPSANGANKTLRAMVRRAGIDKYITWHCLRHSFGTNLVYVGTDISVVGDLMGHSSLKHTPRYIKASNELKERATDKLNINL